MQHVHTYTTHPHKHTLTSTPSKAHPHKHILTSTPSQPHPHKHIFTYTRSQIQLTLTNTLKNTHNTPSHSQKHTHKQTLTCTTHPHAHNTRIVLTSYNNGALNLGHVKHRQHLLLKQLLCFPWTSERVDEYKQLQWSHLSCLFQI